MIKCQASNQLGDRDTPGKCVSFLNFVNKIFDKSLCALVCCVEPLKYHRVILHRMLVL